MLQPQRALPPRSPQRNRSDYVYFVALADEFLDLLLYENARYRVRVNWPVP